MGLYGYIIIAAAAATVVVVERDCGGRVKLPKVDAVEVALGAVARDGANVVFHAAEHGGVKVKVLG